MPVTRVTGVGWGASKTERIFELVSHGEHCVEI